MHRVPSRNSMLAVTTVVFIFFGKSALFDITAKGVRSGRYLLYDIP